MLVPTGGSMHSDSPFNRPLRVVGYVPYNLRARTLQLPKLVGYGFVAEAIPYTSPLKPYAPASAMAVYPSRMAPIGLKLWENAFRMIWNISFFDAEIKMAKKNSKIFAGQFLFSRNWRFGEARQV